MYEFVDEIFTEVGTAYICTDQKKYFVEITYKLNNTMDQATYEELSDCYQYILVCIGR